MNEIRFTPVVPTKPEQPKNEEKTSNRGRKLLAKVFKALILAIIVVLVVVLAWFAKGLVTSRSSSGEVYSAVFLTNGQVYFGKMERNTDKEIALNNVYYLQVAPDSGSTSQETLNTLSQTRFNLVKLGDELHGPTDELFINRSQVIFYEYLRDDSKVVESIKNQK